MKTACAHRPMAARLTKTASHWAMLGSALAIAGGAVLWSDDASASNTLGVAVDYTDGLHEPGTEPGGGVEVYFGPRMDLALLTLTTELSGGFHDLGGDYNPAIYRLVAGGRLGIGVVIRPSVFAHAGVGHLRYDVPLSDERDGRTNLALDGGLALDFTVVPLVDLGVHVSYNWLAGDDDNNSFEWLQAGVHATFVFGS
jgi:hypothetical protein